MNIMISKSQTFSRGSIDLIPFEILDSEILNEILVWRNHLNVRLNMYNSSIISKDEHKLFIEGLKTNFNKQYWLVKRKNQDCGIVNIESYFNNFEESEWGYYLSPRFIGSGVGIEVAYECVQLFFEKLGVKKLIGQIKESNSENRRIQMALGFKTLNLTIKNGENYMYTILEGKVPDNEFKIFQKRLFYERKSKFNIDSNL